MSKADDTPAPTEEQVQQSNAVEEAKWADDFSEEQLVIKSKPEEAPKDESPEEPKVEAKVEDETPIEFDEPAPIVTVEDPGEYQPKDYSFEIEIKGKTHKVDTAEKAAELAEEYAEELNAKQLVSLINKGTQIGLKQDRDRERYDELKAKYDEQTAEQEGRQESIAQLASEMEYLVAKGFMPEVEGQYKDADWSDPQVASQPGVKEQIELITYMTKENDTRAKAGVRPLTSIVDAYNAWQLDSNRVKEEQSRQAEAEARKVAGSRVAGVSASAQQPYVAKGIAVGDPNKFRGNNSVWED